jgi:flagellar hook-associated protein 2
MGSPITFSGFNNIDFSAILNALSAQDRLPVQLLEAEKADLEKQKSAYSTLASRLAAVESASRDLASATAFSSTTASVSNTAAASASSGLGANPGSYEVTITRLARAQVTTTDGAVPDADTTIVASGGTLTIGGVDVVVDGDVTLQGLAEAINETDGIGATASVVRSGSNYVLVLTGKATGATESFGVSNNLTGGIGVSFSATNAQEAQDAELTVNNVVINSASNVVEGAIPGVSLTLQQVSPEPLTVVIKADLSSVENLVKAFTTAYNSLRTFLDQQGTAFANKERDSIGGDPLVRELRNTLGRTLTNELETGGRYSSVTQVGLTLSRTGTLELRPADLQAALTADKDGVAALFQGESGVFARVREALATYTASGGLIPAAQKRLDSQVSKLTDRIAEMERRLATRREALQKEFIATDLAMAQLNASLGQLGAFGSNVSAF